MRWLTRPRHDEDGAVIVLVALVTVVLVGMAALVIDVGALLDEQRQLQNGADAGSLAVAHSCALGPCDPALAEGLADANTRDGDSAVDSVTYPALKQVRVATSTRGAGTTLLPYSFAQALTGETGKTVRASATAAWGPVGKAPALPLAISECDVQLIGIGTYAVITFNTNLAACLTRDVAGAFGWLDGPCVTTFTAGVPAPAKPGLAGSPNCLAALMNTDVLVPVYGTVTGVGNNATYSIVGFAALHLTWFRFPGHQSSPAPCNAPNTCVAGTFVKFVTNGEAGGGTDFGASRVFLVS